MRSKSSGKTSLLKDPKTVKTYTERLGDFLDWCERSGIKHLDQLTEGDDLFPYVSFLRQRKTTRDTLFEACYVYNIFRTCNTFLRANAILFAGGILGQQPRATGRLPSMSAGTGPIVPVAKAADCPSPL